ncbi:MAG: Fur family transcriptional regulator [Bacillota bacterium]
MKSKLEHIAALLKKKGVCVTLQRREILRVFLRTDRHLKADDIYDLTKQNGVSIATVYRTIEILKEHDIIKEITIGKDRYYELKLYSEKCMHIHFKCKTCGAIIDLDDIKLRIDLIKMWNGVEKTYSVEVRELTMVTEGVCSKCRR